MMSDWMELDYVPYEERQRLRVGLQEIRNECANRDINFLVMQISAELMPTLTQLELDNRPQTNNSEVAYKLANTSPEMKEVLKGVDDGLEVDWETGRLLVPKHWNALKTGYMRFGMTVQFAYKDEKGDWHGGTPEQYAETPDPYGLTVDILNVMGMPTAEKEKVEEIKVS